MRFFGIFLFFILGAVFLNRSVSEPLTWKQDSGEILYAGAMTAVDSNLIGAAVNRLGNEDFRRIIRHAGIWAGIFLLTALAHSYRFELAGIRDKVMGNLLPGRSIAEKPGEAVFQISPDGHFYIRALVNGKNVRFLADTGASDIVITPKTAARLGFTPEKLRFDRIYRTANGIGRGASVQLQSLQIGGLYMENISASVNEADMEDSLLGMRFFNRLKGYSVKDGRMRICW